MKKMVRLAMLVAMLAIMGGLFAAGSAEKEQATELRFIDVSPSPTRQ